MQALDRELIRQADRPGSARDLFPQIARFYDQLVQQYGHVPWACDYGQAESQNTKFAVLADAMRLDDRSVLDIGCGFADFAGYLQRRYESVRYTGIDLSSRMINEARELRPDLDLRHGNFLAQRFEETFDFVIC